MFNKVLFRNQKERAPDDIWYGMMNGNKLQTLQISARGRARSNFCLLHLLSTVLFCELAKKHEITYKKDEFGPHFEQLQAYVSSAIMHSFASIEANINEFFLDAPVLMPNEFKMPITEIIQYDALKTLDKYQIALRLAHREIFSKGKDPYQSINILRLLRNELIHFTPGWERNDESIAGYLTPKVNLSPYFKKDDDFVPLRCMTYSVTKWSFETAVSFIDGFYELLGIASKLDLHRNRLKIP